MNKVRSSQKKIAKYRTVGIVVLLFFFATAVFLMNKGYGRALWYPLVVKLIGGKTVEERMREIEARHPDLALVDFHEVKILAFKSEGRLDVYNKGQLWESYLLTARSGRLGPKRQAGDRQIPEGVYRVEGLNSNSSYHLSLRINYPNGDDLARAAASGIADPGGDIYIHGKGVSIGCLAIGDAAIERLFYAVKRSGFASVPVIIAPGVLPEEVLAEDSEYVDLYAKIYRNVRQVQGGQ